MAGHRRVSVVGMASFRLVCGGSYTFRSPVVPPSGACLRVEAAHHWRCTSSYKNVRVPEFIGTSGEEPRCQRMAKAVGNSSERAAAEAIHQGLSELRTTELGPQIPVPAGLRPAAGMAPGALCRRIRPSRDDGRVGHCASEFSSACRAWRPDALSARLFEADAGLELLSLRRRHRPQRRRRRRRRTWDRHSLRPGPAEPGSPFFSGTGSR